MSSTTEETIPIFYLPWWDTFYVCVRCKAKLLSGGANQKWCSYCFIIYCGCRYCLTTNIIFGLTCQTHCKKCKRVTPIFMGNTIVNIGSNEIDDFVYKKRNIVNDLKNIYMKDIDNYDDNPLNVYDFFKEKLCVKSVSEAIIEWIPYSRITNLKEIAKGDFGIIYKATWLDGGISDGTGYSRKKNEIVAIKRFIDSINHKRNLLNELKSYYQCYNEYGHINRYYGITKDLETNEYMLVMKYINMENLLISITRKEKLENVSKESEADKINEKSHSKVTYSMNSSNLREVEDNFIFEFPKKKKKSPNAFIIYRREIVNEIIKASPNTTIKEMSGIAAEGWKNLTPNERNKYYKLAEEANRHDERKIKKTIKQKKEHPYKLEFDAYFSEEGDKSSSPSNIINTVEIPSDTNLIHIDTHDNLKFNIFSEDSVSYFFD
ncbi:hypothetical protein RirG_018250 [Rhizophagus irregularis DAOM 197198w]|uniref:HMG box domain-containing protein n=3 Tax=Rhizophagus irregularis TaxID=588596 RepID=A0A015KEL6_RHIIW|nr:hypothetical protein RirG_018250 [Rhizophagus irregularis DAOM 197198w]